MSSLLGSHYRASVFGVDKTSGFEGPNNALVHLNDLVHFYMFNRSLEV